MTLFKKILERFVKQKLIDPKDEVILLEMYKLYQENDLASRNIFVKNMKRTVKCERMVIKNSLILKGNFISFIERD